MAVVSSDSWPIIVATVTRSTSLLRTKRVPKVCRSV